jgi:hypothetical protein
MVLKLFSGSDLIVSFVRIIAYSIVAGLRLRWLLIDRPIKDRTIAFLL